MARAPFEGSPWGEREHGPAGDGEGAGGSGRGMLRMLAVPALALAVLAVVGFAVATATEIGPVGEDGVDRVDLTAASITAPVERLHAAQRERIKELMSAPFVLGISRKRLETIAECESHSDPRAIGGGGLYRGKYQFHRSTWASVGGVGDPARASELEQDRRAAMLIKRSGSNPWPICG